MANVILYIATSLEGYIARPDGNLEWLTSVPNPESGDYGYQALMDRVGTIIMGRKTYDAVLDLLTEWPYRGFDTYVVSRNDAYSITTSDSYLLTGNLETFVKGLKTSAEKDIWLVGGAELIKVFLNRGYLDEMIITIVPKLIGDGIPLFSGIVPDDKWKLAHVESFNTGLVNLTYWKVG